MINKSFKEALERKPLLGFCSMYASPGIIERIGQDWDWCWIDGQHGEWGTHDIVQAVRACNLAGIFAMVRVPGHEQGVIGKTLDTGCHAVMIPMIESPEQAKAVVRATKFASLGQRSYGGRRPIDLYGRNYANSDQPQPLLICQIESNEALKRADAIAAVDGVDGLLFGPDDVALSRGVMPMDKARPEGCFDAEMAAVAEAAKRHGKIPVGIFITPTAVKKGMELGYRLMICSSDVPLLANNSQSAAKAARTAMGDAQPRPAAGPASFY
jgi:4-hydroxy-2-oxoheptanedioate aldolase